MNRKNFPVMLALSMAMAATGCQDDTVVANAAPNPPRVAVSSAPVKPEPLLVSGPLVVEHQVEVTAQRDGVVTRIASESGQGVKTGDLLAQLDDRQISSDLAAASAKTRAIEADLKNWEAEAKVAQADYDRAQKMWDAHILTKEQLDHARFKAESEQWDIQRVRELLTNARDSEQSLGLELEKTRIRAPFSGVVARRYIREGQQVIKGDRLFWVTEESPLLLRFTLPEQYLGRLHKGQELPLSSTDVPGEQHMAKVTEISPVIDPASGTFEVLVQLIGSSGRLRSGMTASVRLDTLQ